MSGNCAMKVWATQLVRNGLVVVVLGKEHMWCWRIGSVDRKSRLGLGNHVSSHFSQGSCQAEKEA